MVPERADTWTRMVYAGPNKPIAPIDDPYQMFDKLYGRLKDRESLRSVLDDLQDDLKKVSAVVSAEDRRLLDEHADVRPRDGAGAASDRRRQTSATPCRSWSRASSEDNDNMPQISKMQIDLMVNSFAADFARVATLQYTNSVGGAQMRWLGVDEGHHELSHEPDSNDRRRRRSSRRSTSGTASSWPTWRSGWPKRRSRAAQGSLLDNTLIVWTNELGKGNSHTLDNIPFVLVGGGLDFKMGRSLKFRREPHNRLLLSLAHGFGHEIETFGNPDYCEDGPLSGLT